MNTCTYRRTSALLLGFGIFAFAWWMGAAAAPAFAQDCAMRKDDPAQTVKAAGVVPDPNHLRPQAGNRPPTVIHVIPNIRELPGVGGPEMSGVIHAGLGKPTASLPMVTAPVRAASEVSAQRSYYRSFREHNTAMSAVQPSWMGPLIQTDARLGQAIRVSVSDAEFPGEHTLSYGNNHGISLIADRRFEFDLDPPSFFRNHSSARRDGFGNAGTQLKWRIASGNEEHGNYAVSAIVYHAFAPRVYQNHMLTSFYVPAVAAGRGFGRFAVMSALGGILPTSKIGQQGRGIEWDMTAQVHPAARTWFDVEDNALFNYGGPFDGKMQNFLTPAAFYMIRRPEWKSGHAVAVVDGGMQIATSSFHFYNHNFIGELRVIF